MEEEEKNLSNKKEDEDDFEKMEQLYDVLDKNDRASSSFSMSRKDKKPPVKSDNDDEIQKKLIDQIMNDKVELPPRTPQEVKFRQTGSKFLPNHLDAILH